MKKFALTLAIMFAIFQITSSQKTFAQTSPISPAQKSGIAQNELTRDQAIALVINEAKAGRALINDLTAKKQALEIELDAERQNSQSTSKSYETAKQEIAALGKTIALIEKSVALAESQIAKLETENSRLKKKLKKAELEKWITRGAGAIFLILRIL